MVTLEVMVTSVCASEECGRGVVKRHPCGVAREAWFDEDIGLRKMDDVRGRNKGQIRIQREKLSPDTECQANLKFLPTPPR